MLERIISGGQTGVDRAALDAAMERGIDCGGWCPKGRRAEDGAIPERYPLQQTPKKDYAQRTEWNVRDSDATLVICRGTPQGGSAQTLKFARALDKPWLLLDLDQDLDFRGLRHWLEGNGVRVLNVAGPRENQSSGVYKQAKACLLRLLAKVGQASSR